MIPGVPCAADRRTGLCMRLCTEGTLNQCVCACGMLCVCVYVCHKKIFILIFARIKFMDTASNMPLNGTARHDIKHIVYFSFLITLYTNINLKTLMIGLEFSLLFVLVLGPCRRFCLRSCLVLKSIRSSSSQSSI